MQWGHRADTQGDTIADGRPETGFIQTFNGLHSADEGKTEPSDRHAGALPGFHLILHPMLGF